MSGASVRRVETEEDKEALYRFRYEVYVDEYRMTEEADHERRRLVDAWDAEAVSFALFDDTGIVGSLRCLFLEDLHAPTPLVEKFAMERALERFGPAAIATTSRFLLAPHLRHGKAIFRLMRAAYEEGDRRGVRLNYGDCSPHLLPFYEQMGYRRYANGFNDASFGYKLPILMMVRDREHLRSVRSPLARLIDENGDDADGRAWFAETYPDFVAPLSAAFLDTDAFLDLLTERVAGVPGHRVAIMKGLSRGEMATFVAAATVIRLQPGDVVIRAGDHETTVYAMLSGLAEVRPPGRDRPVAILGAGDTFGEIGLLNGVPRTADVVATEPGEALVLSGDAFERLLDQEPRIAVKVLRNLAGEMGARLAATTRQLAG